MSIGDSLLELGFGKTEVAIYLALITGDEALTAKTLSLETGIARTTVVGALQKLNKKGVVSAIPKARGNLYRAEPPAALFLEIESKRNKLQEEETIAQDLVQKLRQIKKEKAKSSPRIQVFEGKNSVESMLYNYNEFWHRSIMQAEKVVWGYQDSDYYKKYQQYSEHYWTVKKGRYPYEIKLFSDDQEFVDAQHRKVRHREIRKLPEKIQFESTLWVGGEYIIMISTREDPHYAIHIHNKTFARDLKSIFKFLWQSPWQKI